MRTLARALGPMAALALCMTGVSLAHVAPAHAGARPVGAASQRLAVLQRVHDVFSAPDHRSSQLAALAAQRPITGERTTVPVLADVTGPDGREWLRVMLPGRPNGHTGWIAPSFTTHAVTAWRLLVQTGRRRVTVLRSGRVVRTFETVVGAGSTPTPLGRFFVEETVQLASDRVGAPFALALSARSDVFSQFDGGPGQIALHGMGNIGGTLGQAESHGCVRLDAPAITWLAARIGPGVPVTITA